MLVVDFFVLLLCTNHRGHISTYGSEPSTMHPLLAALGVYPSLQYKQVTPGLGDAAAQLIADASQGEAEQVRILEGEEMSMEVTELMMVTNPPLPLM